MEEMTTQELISNKTKLKEFGQRMFEERIAQTTLLINNAQEAANNEEKSSAGDKYETSRAMGHLQKDMYARQQAEHVRELNALQKINTNLIYATAQPGAYIKCADQSFFIAAGLGKQTIDNLTVFFLSPLAPIAKLLLHKKAGEKFLFNNKEITILEVY